MHHSKAHDAGILLAEYVRHRLSQMSGDFDLRVERPGRATLDGLAPDVSLADRFDQAHRDAETIAVAADTSLEHVVDPEGFADF